MRSFFSEMMIGRFGSSIQLRRKKEGMGKMMFDD